MGLFQHPEVPESSPHQYLKNCCKWLELKIVILLLVAPLEPWATLLRQPMLPLERPTATRLLTCGKKQFSPNHPTKNSPISWPKITNPLVLRNKKPNNIDFENKLKSGKYGG